MATANIKAVITAEDKASASLKKFSNNAENSASDLSDSFKKAGAVLAATGAVLTAFAKNSTDHLQDVALEARKMARETGLSEVEASKLLAVTKRLGLDAAEASATFGIFSKKIVESGDATSETAQKQAELQNKIKGARIEITQTTEEMRKNGDKSGELKNKIESLNIQIQGWEKSLNEVQDPLKKIGIETKNADGSVRAFDQILLDVADKFKTMPDGVDKTALSMQLFGRSGKELIPILNQGRQGILELEAQAEKLGLTLNAQNFDTVSKYIESQKQLKASTEAVRLQVGLLTAPILTEFNNKLAETTLAVLNADGRFKGLLANILAFGGPLLVGAGGFVAFAANATQAAQGVAAVWTWAASTSVAAWVGARAAMIASALATLATHLAVAAASEAAYYGSAVRSAGAWVAQLAIVRGAAAALSAFIAIPMVMPALVVAAALGSIAMVYAAIQSVIGAIDALNAKARASENAARSAEAVHARLQGLLLSNDPGQRERAQRALNSGLASGTSFATGGMTLVGERGPELVNLPRGAQVYQNDKTRKMLGGEASENINITIQAGAFVGTQMDARKFAEMIMNAYKDLQMSRGVRI